MFNNIVARLNCFEVYANSQIFTKIFGYKSAGQKWREFKNKYNKSSVQFLCSLDFQNQSLLIAYLERYTKDF